jgi:hypothetical protein
LVVTVNTLFFFIEVATLWLQTKGIMVLRLKSEWKILPDHHEGQRSAINMLCGHNIAVMPITTFYMQLREI